MKIEKRKNIDLLLPFKVAVSSENWYKIQHILFSKGYEWRDSGKVLFNSYLKYIFIDENKKIFCYDNKSGEYYEFKNIFEAKMVTELSINHLNDLINIENKKSTSRRWVFGLTMKECEFNVMKVYGL